LLLQDVEAVVYGSSGTTLKSLYNTCSYGKTTLTSASTRVAEVSKLPCSGTSEYGNAYNSAGLCEFGDFAGWAEMALAAATASGINVDNYFYK
jgi:hypothetical protein